MRFGVCAGAQIDIANRGMFNASGNYTISGSAVQHVKATIQGLAILQSITVTLSGTPAFSQQFARASDGGVVYSFSVTFSGSATGQRFNVLQNGTIDTEGGGANYFPGNSAGTTASGGQYT